MFNNAFAGKRVLVTGHTGFKGTWLSLWLADLGAKVHGLSIDIPTQPSMFEALKVADQMDHRFGDVRDAELMRDLVTEVQPDFIFHLAAQPIVSLSYQDPLTTISTNALGTANVLEACRSLEKPATLIVITSDKCYENVEWEWGYRETDQLGGKAPDGHLGGRAESGPCDRDQVRRGGEGRLDAVHRDLRGGRRQRQGGEEEGERLEHRSASASGKRG